MTKNPLVTLTYFATKKSLFYLILCVQDFEDWDDVGLNIPKPQNLLQLYRNYNKYIYLNNEVFNKETQTDALPTVEKPDVCKAESCVRFRFVTIHLYNILVY